MSDTVPPLIGWLQVHHLMGTKRNFSEGLAQFQAAQRFKPTLPGFAALTKNPY